MGFIRGAIVFILSIILFLIILSAGILLTLSMSLEYENVQEHISQNVPKIIQELNAGEVIQVQQIGMQLFCETQESYDLVFENLTIPIPCNIIETGTEEVLEYVITNLAQILYYKQYDCEFFDCFNSMENALVLLSEDAKEYWKSKFYLSILAFAVILLLMFLIANKKHSPLIITGILTIIAALLMKQIDWLTNLLPDFEYIELATIFFTKANTVFLTFLIIGIVLTLVGFAMGFFNWGMKISEFLENIIQKKNQNQKTTKNTTKKK